MYCSQRERLDGPGFVAHTVQECLDGLLEYTQCRVVGYVWVQNWVCGCTNEMMFCLSSST